MIDWLEAAARAAGPGARRCVLLVRHGERPPIEEGDPTYGENLGLTPAGRELALACGRDIAAAGRPADWAFHASRYRRTMLTAATVAEGMGRAGAPVAESEEVSLPGLWVTDMPETYRSYRRYGTAAFTDMFMRGEATGGYRTIPESTRLAMDWIRRADFGARCALVVTHDIFVAPFLQELGAGEFRSTHWIGFLQGTALFERPDGAWDVDYCVPDKAHWRNRFLQ